MSGPQPWHSRYLWLHLQALGFEEAPPPPGQPLKPASLGEHMFDKPNRDAFYMVAHFLFSILDPPRYNETFRYLWPPLDRKRDAEFRKLCCVWLKSISDECGSDFPPVVASLFLSPGGPKFIFLMFSFAKYVVLQQIKKDADDDFLFDALNTKPKDLETASARNTVGCNRFLQVVQKEDLVIKQYQRKAQNLVRQIRDLRAESASLQTQILKFEEKNVQNENTAEKVQAVRSMWGSVMESLMFLKKEKDVVDSVIKGHVDQYTLDGTDASVNIPRRLMDTITNEIDQLQIDNIYEAGNLNLVTLVQLLNETLRILIHERIQQDRKGFKLDLQYIQEKAAFENEVLSKLRHLRNGIRREAMVSVNESIVEKQRDWHFKWEKELGQAPFHAMKNLNPALELESSIVTFSFSPAPEDFLKTSVFCQYPPALKDSTVRVWERNEKEYTETTPSERLNLRTQLAQFATPGSKSNRRRSEVSSYGGTPKLTPYGMKKGRVDDRKRFEDPFTKARLQLVQQVAEIVAEPQIITPGKKVEMDRILDELSTDPFSSQKQIPRTPESLILDIKSFWRDAIQTGDASGVNEECVRLTPAPPDPTNQLISSHGGQTNSSMACFFTDSHLSVPRDSSKDFSLDCVSSVPFEESFADHAGGCGALKMTTNWVNETMSFSTQGLTTHLLHGDQMQTNVQNSSNRNGNLQRSVFHQGNSAHSTLSWDPSPRMASCDELDSQEVIHFGLPHKTQDTSLNTSNSLETVDGVVASRTKEDPQSKLELQAIRSKLEKLKMAMRKNSREVEDLYKSPARQFVKHRSASCLSLQYVENSDMFSPAENKLSLDLDFLETSPCTGLGGKATVPLFSPFEEPFTSIEHEDLHMLEIQEYDQD